MFRRLSRGDRAGASHYTARHFRVWISVTTRVGETAAVDPESTLFKAFEEATEAVSSILDAQGFLSFPWDGATYVATMRELTNPHLARLGKTKGATYDVDRELRDSVVDHATAIDVKRDAISFTSAARCEVPVVNAVAMGVSGYPEAITLNAMAGLLGGGLQNRATLTDPYLVTAVVEPTEPSADRTAVAMKLARVKQLQHTEIGLFLTDLGKRSRDLAIASEACQEGGGLCKVLHEVLSFVREDAIAGADARAKAILTEAGLEGELDAGLQMMGYLLALPMEAGTSLMADARVARHTSTKTRKAASHMLPVLGEFRSSPARLGETEPTPMVLLTTRSGELFGIDLFANRNGNHNAIVVAKSGAGKSVFIEDLVMAMLATGGRVWVFDIGKSYEHCADLVGGQWIDFADEDSLMEETEELLAFKGRGSKEGLPPFKNNEAARLCLNPLDVRGDALNLIDEIAEVIVTLANGDVPLEITALEKMKGALERVLREREDPQDDYPPTITDLVSELLADGDPELLALSVRLRPYAAGGRYAKWFEGRNSVNFQSPFVVLEMQSLAEKAVLQNAVILILIMRIISEIKASPRSDKKLIVIDEAWRLLTGNSGAFIEWACRTLRKYGAGIICISQSMEDFEKGSAARAVRANADNVFLLRQKRSSIDLYTDDPYTREVISSLTTEAGLFSEMYVKLGDRPGVVGRLMLDRFSMTAYSTRADVFEAVEREKRRGKSTVKAIATVAESPIGEGR